jgi:hypothetical protein
MNMWVILAVAYSLDGNWPSARTDGPFATERDCYQALHVFPIKDTADTWQKCVSIVDLPKEITKVFKDREPENPEGGPQARSDEAERKMIEANQPTKRRAK